MKRLNITIPDNLAKKLDYFPNKSKFIADAIKVKLQIMYKEELKKDLIEGYKASNEEDKSLISDWDAISSDGWD